MIADTDGISNMSARMSRNMLDRFQTPPLVSFNLRVAAADLLLLQDGTTSHAPIFCRSFSTSGIEM
jgi:hypothetical protein